MQEVVDLVDLDLHSLAKGALSVQGLHVKCQGNQGMRQLGSNALKPKASSRQT